VLAVAARVMFAFMNFSFREWRVPEAALPHIKTNDALLA
jgi:hypothetical protein